MTVDAGELANNDFLIIKYDGADASRHVLTLDIYIESLAGWRDFFTIATEIYLRSDPALRSLRRDDLFRFQIRAEREGSWEVVLGLLAGGILGNRADAVFVALCRRLWKWYRDLASNHIAAKRQSRNVDQIVASLEEMARQNNIALESSNAVAEEIEVPAGDLLDDADDQLPEVASPVRSLADKIDASLRRAVTPIGIDCNSICVSGATSGFTIVTLGAVEKAILDEPLTLPLPGGTWNPMFVRFERINRKTGRALIYIDQDGERSESASYAKIVDPAYGDPGNIYAQAFTDDAQLAVWGRQIRGERGRLNLMWQISNKPPEQLAMFGPKGGRMS